MCARSEVGQEQILEGLRIRYVCCVVEYLETTVTIQNLIHEEIKNGLNYDNAYHHSVQVFPSAL
jgi:hypothetical protein